MDIYCLKSGISQTEEERNTFLEKLRESITPESGTESGTVDETAEQRPQLQSALDLLASGTVESICFRTPDVLARSIGDIDKLKGFLSESNIELRVTGQADIRPEPADSGHKTGGTETKTADEVDAS